MIISYMHVSDMTEQRRQILQREVISTKQLLILTMMDLTMQYPMKLQVEIHNERYFDGFSRCFYVTPKSHECEQV